MKLLRSSATSVAKTLTSMLHRRCLFHACAHNITNEKQRIAALIGPSADLPNLDALSGELVNEVPLELNRAFLLFSSG
jgi:hypothetical protein